MIEIYHITTDYENTPYDSKIFSSYFSSHNYGVLDIETTGLSPVNSIVVLGGLLVCSDGRQTMHQFFAENMEEEAALLRTYYAEINKLDYIITFNGKHFDMPFLQKRMRHHGMMQNTMPYNLDLYLLANGFSDLRSMLPNLKQTTIENFMGLWSTRDDEISGAESVDLYFQYLKSHNTDIRDKILLHNNDDVLQLHKLLKLTSKVDFHKAMFKSGFPVASLEIREIDLKGKHLKISGVQKSTPCDYIAMSTDEQPYNVMFDGASGGFEIVIPVFRKEGIAYVDLKAMTLCDASLQCLPGCVEDFLVLENHSALDYSAVNYLAKQLLLNICTRI